MVHLGLGFFSGSSQGSVVGQGLGSTGDLSTFLGQCNKRRRDSMDFLGSSAGRPWEFFEKQDLQICEGKLQFAQSTNRRFSDQSANLEMQREKITRTYQGMGLRSETSGPVLGGYTSQSSWVICWGLQLSCWMALLRMSILKALQHT